MFNKKEKAKKSAITPKSKNGKSAQSVKKPAAKKQKNSAFPSDRLEEMMMFEMFFDDD
ncbi:MAG: hypothetical protein IJK60_04655 [Clostridia bacterium]|nr:hypothetical protein [Clostridia bacterium]